MQDTIIKVENISEYAAIVSLLFTYRYRHYDDKNFETLTKDWGNGVIAEYSWVCVDSRAKSFCGYKKSSSLDGLGKVSFVEGLAFLTKELKTAKIDIGEYKACVYNENQVSVGCQTIPFETIEKLYNGMKALKN